MDVQTNLVFYEKLMFVYLEMPKFNKEVEDLKTRFEKWLYVLKNLHKLDRVPERLRESIFMQLFETAEIAKFTKEEYHHYEDSLKYYRDLKNSLDTSKEEGKMERTKEIARNMLSDNESVEKIIKYTGLSAKDIEKLKKLK